MVDIHKLIAAISPDIYCDKDARKEVKKIAKSDGYLKAAGKAKPLKSDIIFNYDKAKNNALSAWGLKSPSEKHELMYDSASESLEPIYFWIHDFLKDMGMDIDKLVDNFSSTVGSYHFGEMGQRLSLMQKQGMDMLGAANQVVKAILNLVYDLKEMRSLLRNYEDADSDDPKVRIPATFALKQRWMDKVDINKGQGSINALASGQLDFVTLRDAFMAAKSMNHINDLDLNDRVKRILQQRFHEFQVWVKESSTQLKTRYELEKNYLRSQVNSVKLYSRWIRPYLQAARKLEQKDSSQSALVKSFSTTILELKILAKSKYNPKGDAGGALPKMFENVKARDYYSIVIVEFDFRAIPGKTQRGDYTFGGRAEVKFTSYALNEQELKVLKEQVEKDDIGEVLELIEGATTESLDKLKKDIDEFLNEDKKEKKKEKPKNEDDTNPFSALFSFLKKDKKDKKDEDISSGIKPDDEYEKIIRSQAIIEAREKCFTVFDIYKKGHGMPSHASPYDSLA